MNKHLRILLGALAVAASSSATCAETYGAVQPGVYFGAGNPNGNFNIDRENNIELGLRAKNRSPVGPVLLDGSSGTYTVPGGFCMVGCGSPKAKWNYEFSIHTVDGSGLSDYTFQLGVDHDASSGVSFSWVDPVAYWSDNAKDGMAGIQNSENISFGDTPGGSISANAPGLYDFMLKAYAPDGTLAAQADMTVHVPEPGSLALFGLGLVGLGALGRRKFNKA